VYEFQERTRYSILVYEFQERKVYLLYLFKQLYVFVDRICVSGHESEYV